MHHICIYSTKESLSEFSVSVRHHLKIDPRRSSNNEAKGEKSKRYKKITFRTIAENMIDCDACFLRHVDAICKDIAFLNFVPRPKNVFLNFLRIFLITEKPRRFSFFNSLKK